jgi:Ca2+/Na+ antiporter
MKKVVSSLLWHKREIPRLVLAGLGFSLGLFVLLAALRFSNDLRDILYPSGSAGDTRFIVINKKVNLRHTLGLGKSAFSAEEIQELMQQAFIRDVGSLVTTNFTVAGGISFGLNRALHSEMLFEAVPDRFLDDPPAAWAWQEGQTQIPVIISREFLALYNFGFAAAQGLPQLTESTIGLFPIYLECFGADETVHFSARIAGFTDRFPTILVPMDFMTWANTHIGAQAAPLVSRLVLEIDSAGEAALQDYLQARSYETNQEKLATMGVARSLKIALLLVSVFGVVLILVSLLTLMLIGQLLISQAQNEIQLLHHLGFTDGFLSRCYVKVMLPVISIPFVLAGAAVFAAGFSLRDVLSRIGYSISPYPEAAVCVSFVIAYFAVCILFYLLILRSIRRVT